MAAASETAGGALRVSDGNPAGISGRTLHQSVFQKRHPSTGRNARARNKLQAAGMRRLTALSHVRPCCGRRGRPCRRQQAGLHAGCLCRNGAGSPDQRGRRPLPEVRSHQFPGACRTTLHFRGPFSSFFTLHHRSPASSIAGFFDGSMTVVIGGSPPFVSNDWWLPCVSFTLAWLTEA